jgi:hypothetical protein
VNWLRVGKPWGVSLKHHAYGLEARITAGGEQKSRRGRRRSQIKSNYPTLATEARMGHQSEDGAPRLARLGGGSDACCHFVED